MVIAQSTQSWMNGLNGCALVQTYVSWNSKNSNAKWPLMWQAGALFDFFGRSIDQILETTKSGRSDGGSAGNSPMVAVCRGYTKFMPKC